ncbi:uncharacterized protein TNCV_3370191 [Trichonephila clavipes]|nr:uncharacterized protein TNCV_3370191 [Trichonephila clavipes]
MTGFASSWPRSSLNVPSTDHGWDYTGQQFARWAESGAELWHEIEARLIVIPQHDIRNLYNVMPNDNFFLGFEQSFCFVTVLASKTIVDEGRGSSVLASLARKSVPSHSLRCQHGQGSTGLPNVPMENRSKLISWVSLIFPSLMASIADLQSESTMMPSELAIFVRVR